MIKLNCLRIGNAVSDPIGMDKMVSIEVFQNIRKGLKYTGIEITSEILEKCNRQFPLIKNGTPQAFHGKDLDNFMWVINRDSESWFFSFLHETENPIIRFYYLHELQNAYYLLTKEELTYTP